MIARAVREAAPGVRVATAQIAPPGYDEVRPAAEFDGVHIRCQGRGDEGFADALERAMDRSDPDLICLDLSPVPWLYLVRFPPVPRAYVTNFFLTKLLAAETFQDLDLRENSADWNHRRRRRQLPELHDAKELYDANAVLLSDPPELVPREVRVEEPYRVVGPCIWQPVGSLPAPLIETRRLLLLTFGSTGSRLLPGDVAEKLRRALGCDTSVWLASKSPGGEREDHGGHVFSGVPMAPVLQRSVLAVTQGGAGSTYAALLQGVPVAVWPSHRNHELLAEMLARAGVGILAAELAALEPSEIRREVARMQRKLSEISTTTRGDLSAPAARAAAALLSMI